MVRRDVVYNLLLVVMNKNKCLIKGCWNIIKNY